jgi:hypothetical protein
MFKTLLSHVNFTHRDGSALRLAAASALTPQRATSLRRLEGRFEGCVHASGPGHEQCVCVYTLLLLQYLLQSCMRGGRGIVEDVCYERRRVEALVD